MTEDPTDFLREREIKVEYLHSDIDAIERVELLRNLRTKHSTACWGQPSEGRIDLPEVASSWFSTRTRKELRSETSLIQTAGRAAA